MPLQETLIRQPQNRRPRDRCVPTLDHRSLISCPQWEKRLLSAIRIAAQNKIGNGPLERPRDSDIHVFLKWLAIVERIREILRMVAWVDAEYEVMSTTTVVGCGQENCPAEIVHIGVKERQSFELGFVRVIRGGGRRVQSIIDIADLQGSGCGELKSEKIVEGGLAVAARWYEEAGLGIRKH